MKKDDFLKNIYYIGRRCFFMGHGFKKRWWSLGCASAVEVNESSDLTMYATKRRRRTVKTYVPLILWRIFSIISYMFVVWFMEIRTAFRKREGWCKIFLKCYFNLLLFISYNATAKSVKWDLFNFFFNLFNRDGVNQIIGFQLFWLH